MALGKLKWAENLDPRLGTNGHYWVVKVQADYSSDAEEVWLVTNFERKEFLYRAAKNPEDDSHKRRGVFTVLDNTKRPKFSRAAKGYYAVKVESPDGFEWWFMTDRNIERVRSRSSARVATMAANQDGWLSDLFD